MFLRLFQHLLPRSKSWRITIDKTLRQFFDGLTGLPEDIKEFFDLIWLDIDPQQTRELDAWEQQFGLQDTGITEQERRDRLEAAWKQTGGQDPTYIQDTLQAAGFSVYIHEWWVPGSEPAVNVAACATPRDPSSIVGLEVFVSGRSYIEPIYIAQTGGTNVQTGNPDSFTGHIDGFQTKEPVVEIPTDPDKWPYFLYFGAATFGTFANVPATREQEFKTLLKQICPGQHWLGLMINFI